MVYSQSDTEETSVEIFPLNFPVPDEKSINDLKEILASKDFGGTKEGWGIRFKSDDEMDLPDIDLSPWLENIRRIFSTMLRAVVVLAIAGFLGFALYRYTKYRKANAGRNRGRSFTNPSLSMRSPESLFEKAEEHFRAGGLREAWAACLSGCLGAYTRDHSLDFPVNATEYNCLSLAAEALPEKAAAFGNVVNNWVRFAYGHKTPAREDFEKALVFGLSLVEVISEP
jgi:hypothetical protein